jgi:hypothetical protein
MRLPTESDDPCSRKLHAYRPVVVTADDTCTRFVQTALHFKFLGAFDLQDRCST